MKKNKLKTGSCTNEELAYIEENMGVVPIEDMARKLRRTVAFVKKYVGRIKHEKEVEGRDSYIFRLRASPFWNETKKNLDDNEVKYFEESWASYCDQLSTVDILPTDELTIKDLIMLDILCNRILTEKKRISNEIQKLREQISLELEKPADERDDALITMFNEQISRLRNYEFRQDGYYKDYQAKKTSKLNTLKATRDQRLKHMEESKKNIWELLKELDKREMRKREGIINEKVRAAVKNLRNEWSKPTKFSDGNYDAILLSGGEENA